MSKLNVCSNGISVTDQVVRFKETRSNDDYIPIQEYYDDFKAFWFNRINEINDWETFEDDFNYKLFRAVDAFDHVYALSLARSRGWSLGGMFNRFFYAILSNWRANVKATSFRPKRRPVIQCPICDRMVTRIDIYHLQHYKTVKDLPKYMCYGNKIYEVPKKVSEQVVCWGDYTTSKWQSLNSDDSEKFLRYRRKVDWPWFDFDNEPMVVCPWTGRKVSQIDDNYIKSLPDQYSRYARPYTWEDFLENYPRCLIQSEMYELSFTEGPQDERNPAHFSDMLYKDCRIGEKFDVMSAEEVLDGRVRPEYTRLFAIIDTWFDNEDERMVLKLSSVGFNASDIAEHSGINRSQVKRIIKRIRSEYPEFEQKLTEEV